VFCAFLLWVGDGNGSGNGVVVVGRSLGASPDQQVCSSCVFEFLIRLWMVNASLAVLFFARFGWLIAVLIVV